jgi:2-dehydro-3-deoxygalactonokinase
MSARYLLGDWGTTHLRRYLVEQEDTARMPAASHRVIAMRKGAGIGSLQRPPAAELAHLVEQWFGLSQPMDIVLCGMASSRNGLRELPYLRCPAGLAGWAQGAATIELGSRSRLRSPPVCNAADCSVWAHRAIVMPHACLV